MIYRTITWISDVRQVLLAHERQIFQNSTIRPRGYQPRLQHTGIKRSVGCHKTVNKMGRGGLNMRRIAVGKVGTPFVVDTTLLFGSLTFAVALIVGIAHELMFR